MNIKRPLAPKFLNKLDEHLLLHQPETWTSRTHLVVYYGLLFMAALAGLCFIIPNDPKSDTTVFYWIGFVAIISGLAIIGWMIFLLRFNVFKRYGNITALGRLKTFLLYFVSIAIITLFAYVPLAVESIRANYAYDGNEIVKDINSINTKICQIEYDSLKHRWSEDTVIVVDKKSDAQVAYESVKESGVDNPDTLMAIVHPPYQVIDTAELTNKLNSIDSVVKINDTLYVFNECPDYNFLTVNGADNTSSFFGHGKPQLFTLTSIELFNNVIRHYKRPDVAKLKREIAVLAKKYDYNNGYGYYDTAMDRPLSSLDDDLSYEQRRDYRYRIGIIKESMDNIVERKYRWNSSDIDWMFRIFFYISFSLTLLVFVFRHSTVKTFFLSLLTAIILTILSSLTIAFSSYNDHLGFIWLIFYTVLFAALSCTAFSSKKRSLVSGISINLFILLVTFLPLTIVTYYYELIKQPSYTDTYRHNPIYRDIDYDMMYRNILIAEITGFVLLLVLIPTLIHRLYRRWYALPQE
jgi:hypothetical protein